jgi:hypothetical protein
MSRSLRAVAIAAAVLLIGAATVVGAGDKSFSVGKSLSGFEEVPAVSTLASGTFSASLNGDGTVLDWELSYADLEGAVQQAHIHFGQSGVNGGITVFLCTNLGNGPAGTQPCPAPPATISGSITAADVVGSAAAQGIAAGEWEELLAAMRAGVTYVNVHSTKFPGGEIRAQLAKKK